MLPILALSVLKVVSWLCLLGCPMTDGTGPLEWEIQKQVTCQVTDCVVQGMSLRWRLFSSTLIWVFSMFLNNFKSFSFFWETSEKRHLFLLDLSMSARCVPVTNWAQETRQVAMTQIWTGSTLGHVHSWSRSVEISRVIWGGGLPFIACNVNGRMCCSESQKGSAKDHRAAFRLAAGWEGWLTLLLGLYSSLQNRAPLFFFGWQIWRCWAACTRRSGSFMSERLAGNFPVRQNQYRSCCCFTHFMPTM